MKATKCFVDVNKYPMKKSKQKNNKVVLAILITENKNTQQPLLELDWLDELEIGLQGNTNTNINRNIMDERAKKSSMNLKIC